MFRHRISAAVLALTVGFLVGPARAGSLVLVTEDNPPFNMQKAEGQEITGAVTEILRKAFDRAGVAYKISLYPWARAYSMAQTDADTCVYSTSRNDEREPLFKWVGPLAHNDWMLFGRADSPKLGSLADAKAYVVGGYQGGAQTEYLKTQGFKVEEANADQLNPKKLAAARIDFWAAGRMKGPYVAAREGVDGLVPAFDLGKSIPYYLACNKSVSDDTIGKLNAAIKLMWDDGTVATISKAF